MLKKIDDALHRMKGRNGEEDKHYVNLKRKRDAIANGTEYRTFDATGQLVAMIAYVGGCIPTINQNTSGDLIPIKKNPALVALEIKRKWEENKNNV